MARQRHNKSYYTSYDKKLFRDIFCAEIIDDFCAIEFIDLDTH